MAPILLSDLPCPPLYGTPRTPERPTLGPRVAEVAARLGKPLMPHQKYIADVAFEIDPATGLLAYSEVVVIGPRQATGKTELLLSVMSHRCIGMPAATNPEGAKLGPQRVLYLAQTAEDARKKWREVHLPRVIGAPEIRQHMIDPRDEFGGARISKQREAMLWRNGSLWSPGANTGKTAGTGDTLDLGVIDEAWAHPDNRTELSIRPAMMTRDNKQLWIMSMVPGPSRAALGTWKYLQAKRQVGRARVDADVRTGTAFFDFAAPGDASTTDPLDPDTWWRAMPGLGRTVRESTVREDFELATDLSDLCAEYLGWEPHANTPRWLLVSQQTWGDLRDPESMIVGQSALCIIVSEDRRQAWIVSAGRRADNHWHVEVVEPGQEIPPAALGMDWVLPRALEICRTPGNQVCTVVIDTRGPAQSFVAPLRNAKIHVTTPNVQEVAGACGRFFDATGEGAPVLSDVDEDEAEALMPVRVFHLGQPELDRAVAVAKKLDQGNGAMVFVKKGSEADLLPLNGAALAMHGYEVKARRPGRSRIY